MPWWCLEVWCLEDVVNLKLTTKCRPQLWAMGVPVCGEEVVARVVDTEKDVMEGFQMMDVLNLLSTSSRRRRQSAKKVY